MAYIFDPVSEVLVLVLFVLTSSDMQVSNEHVLIRSFISFASSFPNHPMATSSDWLDTAGLFDHGRVQTEKLKVRLSQRPRITGTEHRAPQAIKGCTFSCLVRTCSYHLRKNAFAYTFESKIW